MAELELECFATSDPDAVVSIAVRTDDVGVGIRLSLQDAEGLATQLQEIARNND